MLGYETKFKFSIKEIKKQKNDLLQNRFYLLYLQQYFDTRNIALQRVLYSQSQLNFGEKEALYFRRYVHGKIYCYHCANTYVSKQNW